jgi:hypothetical protein
MQVNNNTNTAQVRLRHDISKAGYELLLFTSVFGDGNLRELAKAELASRNPHLRQSEMASAVQFAMSICV